VATTTFFACNFPLEVFYLRNGDILIEVNGSHVSKLISDYENVIDDFGSTAIKRKIGSRLLQTKTKYISLTICRQKILLLFYATSI
jgi:hypothetical protein